MLSSLPYGPAMFSDFGPLFSHFVWTFWFPWRPNHKESKGAAIGSMQSTHRPFANESTECSQCLLCSVLCCRCAAQACNPCTAGTPVDTRPYVSACHGAMTSRWVDYLDVEARAYGEQDVLWACA